ncbi:MAG: hypothetical protein WDW38_009284 [Sanguina aurantia]
MNRGPHCTALAGVQLATRTAAVREGSVEEAGEHVVELLQSSLTTHLVEQLELLNANQGSAATAEGARTHAAAAVSALQLQTQILIYAAAVVTRLEGVHAGAVQLLTDNLSLVGRLICAAAPACLLSRQQAQAGITSSPVDLWGPIEAICSSSSAAVMALQSCSQLVSSTSSATAASCWEPQTPKLVAAAAAVAGALLQQPPVAYPAASPATPPAAAAAAAGTPAAASPVAGSQEAELAAVWWSPVSEPALARSVEQMMKVLQALATPLQPAPAAAAAALAALDVRDSAPASSPSTQSAAAPATDAAATAFLDALPPDVILGLVEHVLRTGSCPLPMHLQAAEVVSIIVEHPGPRAQLYSSHHAMLSLATTFRKFIAHHTTTTRPLPPHAPSPSSTPAAPAPSSSTNPAPPPPSEKAAAQSAMVDSIMAQLSEHPDELAGPSAEAQQQQQQRAAASMSLTEAELRCLYKTSLAVLRCVAVEEPREEGGGLAALLPVICGMAQLLSSTCEPTALAYPAAMGGTIATTTDKFTFLSGFLLSYGESVIFRASAQAIAQGMAACVQFAASVKTDGAWQLPTDIVKLLVMLSQGAGSAVAAALYRIPELATLALGDDGLAGMVVRMDKAGVEPVRFLHVVMRGLIELSSPSNEDNAAAVTAMLASCTVAGPPMGCWTLGCGNLAGASERSMPASLCGACRKASYCSSTCQRKDWAGPDGHKAACKRRIA